MCLEAFVVPNVHATGFAGGLLVSFDMRIDVRQRKGQGTLANSNFTLQIDMVRHKLNNVIWRSPWDLDPVRLLISKKKKRHPGRDS